MGYRSGFAALIGRPNVGKSTLLNRLIGRKVSIISEKPQTTRNRIMGVLHGDDYQIIFVDTPGVHKPKRLLGEVMMKTVRQSLDGVDVVLFLVEPDETPGGGDRFISHMLGDTNLPVILVINKIDMVSEQKLELSRGSFSTLMDFTDIFPISALTGKGVPALVLRIAKLLPEGPEYFPQDMVTDQPERLLVAEFVREQILERTAQEVPHSVGVLVTEMREGVDRDVLYISAAIFVERESQKGIIVGSGGRMIKAIGQGARDEIEKLLSVPVYLDLFVKVKKNWRDRAGALSELGLDPGKA